MAAQANRVSGSRAIAGGVGTRPMAPLTCAPPPPNQVVRPLFEILNQLDSAIIDLNGEVEELTDRLEPVLEPTAPASAGTAAPTAFSAGLIVARIESAQAAVRQLTERLRTLRVRLVV